jgi:CRISPR-associated protein Csb2
MPLALTITLMTGRYEASGAGDRDSSEWPPHPARVFCALVAGARDEEERAALRWLESQEPPLVTAAPLVSSPTRQAYVVTNAREPKGGSQTHPGRTNAFTQQTAAVPSQATVHLEWAREPDESTVSALDRLARRVPYLGRSTGVAMLSVGVRAGADDRPDGLVTYEPCGIGQAAELLRVPYRGYLDELTDLHEAGRSAWEASRAIGYRQAGSAETTDEEKAAPASVYADFVTLRFSGVRLDGRLAPMVTEALRRAVMANTADPLPDVLHGHGADGRPHVAFLALPAVGQAHADGHLLGVGVAVPDVPAEERKRIVRGVLGPRDRDGILRLSVPRIGELELLYEPGVVRPWGATPERWRRGSKRWVTATPMVLDRFPKKGHEEDEVLRSCRQMGLPDPVDVQTSTAPLVSGGVRLRPRDLPQQNRGRLYRHVDVTFDERVPGPMLLGAGRYLGVGLLVPMPEVN